MSDLNSADPKLRSVPAHITIHTHTIITKRTGRLFRALAILDVAVGVGYCMLLIALSFVAVAFAAAMLAR